MKLSFILHTRRQKDTGLKVPFGFFFSINNHKIILFYAKFKNKGIFFLLHIIVNERMHVINY